MFVFLGASQVVRMLNLFPVEDSLSLAVSGASASLLNPEKRNLWLRSILKTHILKRSSQNNAFDFDRDVLIIMAGTNDIKANVGFVPLQKALKALILYALRHFGRIVLGKIPQIPLYPRHVNQMIDAINQWLATFCSGQSLRGRIHLVDSFSPFMRQDSWEPNRRFYEEYYSRRRGEQERHVDLLHLNEEGLFILHQLLMEAALR